MIPSDGPCRARPRRSGLPSAGSGPGRAGRPLLAGLLLLLAACAGSRTRPAGGPAPARASAGGAAATTALDTIQPALKPGDAVLLKIWREKQLSDTLQVDEDGELTLPLLGTRNVAGVPADSLKRQLLADYREYIKSPAIEIKVLRRISVLGAVKKPGLYPVDPTYTLTDALALAGGPTGNADRGDIRLLRDGEVVRKSLEETHRIANTPIRSGDQIIVGRKSFFAQNWQWIVGTLVSSSVIILTR